MNLNQAFIDYYTINLNLSDSDFNEFTSILMKPLPMTFRILDRTLCQHIESYNLAKKVPIFNDVYECDKEDYKESQLRQTLIDFTNISKVYRQEIASMLPVYFLNVRENDYVLDMCAAPGSKSMQILQKIKNGLFIANDCNVNRCNILRSNIKQLCNSSVLITNQDSRCFPTIYGDDKKEVFFDKILCDVPCSGDGTIRKNKEINIRWNKNNAIGHMKTQFDILRRGLKMLKKDGVLVYSTCSFNPLENECIVQRAVKECNCEVQYFSPPANFKFRPGLTKWDPLVQKTEKNEWYFPDGLDNGLEKCMRLFPQDQNTGGFFIAVLKLSMKKQENIATELQIAKNLDSKILYKSAKGDFIFYNVESHFNKAIEEQFGIKIKDRLISQSLNDRQISIVSNSVYNVLDNNPQLFIISAGYIAFSKIGFKHGEDLYRPKPNVLEQFLIEKNQIIKISEDDALKLLETDYIDNELLSFKMENRGCYIIQFGEFEGLYCLWQGLNKSGIMLNHKFKNAIKKIILFKKNN